MKYIKPSEDDLTLNDAYRIKVATRVDIFNPPTTGHKTAALLWFASQTTDEPLIYAELLDLSLTELADLIEDDDEEEADEPKQLDDIEIPADEVDDSSPKDSSTSTLPASHVPGESHQ